MSATWSARGGHVVVFLRCLREAGPLLKSYVRLARAETALAAGEVRGLSIAFALATMGGLITLIALVGGLMQWLIQSGLALWQALLWITVPSVLITAIGVFAIVRRYERMTLPQTRKRVHMLLELIDEDR